jgi:hypothetical protein
VEAAGRVGVEHADEPAVGHAPEADALVLLGVDGEQLAVGAEAGGLGPVVAHAQGVLEAPDAQTLNGAGRQRVAAGVDAVCRAQGGRPPSQAGYHGAGGDATLRGKYK